MSVAAQPRLWQVVAPNFRSVVPDANNRIVRRWLVAIVPVSASACSVASWNRFAVLALETLQSLRALIVGIALSSACFEVVGVFFVAAG